jgi:hypothetical protein
MSTELQDKVSNMLRDLDNDVFTDSPERAVFVERIREAAQDLRPIVDGPLPVWTYADLSTSHIAEHDSLQLSRLANRSVPPLLVVYEYEEGFWVHVPDASDIDERIAEVTQAKFSLAFIALLRLARAQNLAFIRFDSDGTVVESLERFDW